MSILSRHIITGAGFAQVSVIFDCRHGPLDDGNGVCLSQTDAGGPLDAPEHMPAGSTIGFGDGLRRPDVRLTHRWMFS